MRGRSEITVPLNGFLMYGANLLRRFRVESSQLDHFENDRGLQINCLQSAVLSSLCNSIPLMSRATVVMEAQLTR